MFDYLLTDEQLKFRDEARELVKWVPRQMILDMDKDEIKFPSASGNRGWAVKWGLRCLHYNDDPRTVTHCGHDPNK